MAFLQENIVLTVVMFGLILLGFFHLIDSFSDEGKLKRAFKNYKSAKILECPDGKVSKIQGDLALCHSPIKSLCSERDCAAFCVRMEEEYYKDMSEEGCNYEALIPHWRTISSKEQTTDFLINQNGEYALVYTDNAQFVWHHSIQFTQMIDNNSNRAIEKKAKQILEQMDVMPHSFVHTHAGFRCQEALLSHGSQVAVCGQGHWRSIEDFDFLSHLAEQGIEKILVFRHDAKMPLYISQSQKHLRG